MEHVAICATALRFHEPMDAMDALRTSARMAKSCGQCPVIARLDIERAFDQLEAYSAGEGFFGTQALAWAISAVLQEMADQKAWKLEAGVICDPPVVMGKQGRQGALAPPLCHYVMRAFARPLVRECESHVRTKRCQAHAAWPIF